MAICAFSGVPGADHGFLHQIGGVFVDFYPGQRRHDQSDAARMAEFEGRLRIAVDKVSSTAASSGRWAWMTAASPSCRTRSRSAKFSPVLV